MCNSVEIRKGLKEAYFWDVDINTIDLKKSKRLIIERVFSMGDISDMRKLIEYYGENQIVDVLIRINYLDSKTANFVSKIFDIPLEKFQCHTRKQSVPQYWNS